MSQYEYDQVFWNGPPRFIALEGDEGGGKTTQVELLKRFIESVADTEVEAVREPGTGITASKLRAVLLDPETKASAYEEALLMATARIDTRLRHVMPALAAGKWVLSDRAELSSIVYQGFARDEGAMVFVKWLQDEIRAVVTRADLYVILGLPTELSRQRLEQGGAAPDRFESEANRFRERISTGFDLIDTFVPGEYRIARVDASRPIEEVTQSLITVIETAF